MAAHYNPDEKKEIRSIRVDSFVDDILAVYKKHGFGLSHEDIQGAFIIEPFDLIHVDLLDTATLRDIKE